MFPFPDTLAEPLAKAILHDLYRLLPPPSDDTPEALEIRDVRAMASIARLGPANTLEAEFALHAVVAQAHATRCMEAVNRCGDDVKRASQCRAQAGLMLRQATRALRELRILQTQRLTQAAQRAAEAASEANWQAFVAENATEAAAEQPPAAAPEGLAPARPSITRPTMMMIMAARGSSRAPGRRPMFRRHEPQTSGPAAGSGFRSGEARFIASLPPGLGGPAGMGRMTAGSARHRPQPQAPWTPQPS